MADLEQIPSTFIAYASEESLSPAEISLCPTVQGAIKKLSKKCGNSAQSAVLEIKTKSSVKKMNFPLWKNSRSPVSQNATTKHYYLGSSYL